MTATTVPVHRRRNHPDPSTQILPAGEGTSLKASFEAYFRCEVANGNPHTFDAKHRDLQQFLEYFTEHYRSDDIDGWTKSATNGFAEWLASEANQGKPYAPTTVNRKLDVLRRTCRWIHKRRPFPYTAIHFKA